jgi:predicted nucleotidyltransferase
MRDDLAEAAKKHGILLMLRFGSWVTGKTHARSDLDIAVLLDHPKLSWEQHADLLHDIQALFPEQEVDLGLINHADPLFLKKITDDCQILYGPVERLQRLKIYAYKR